MSATFLFPDTSCFQPDMKETARYLGYSRTISPDQDVSDLMEKAAREMKEIMKPQAVFDLYELSLETEGEKSKISFADVELHSRDLGTNLKECKKLALLAATIGPQVDALIRRHSSLTPVYASILQATGAMYIEELVDLVNNEIKKIALSQGLKTRPRYSPGYGDIPLEVQKDFFRLLPCTRIGLTLMDTLIMAPEKSVTAFTGLY